MQTTVKYHSETQAAQLGGKTITYRSRTPVLSPKEREKRKKEVEKRLFDVFIKYANK